jgi:hypothetical protein
MWVSKNIRLPDQIFPATGARMSCQVFNQADCSSCPVTSVVAQGRFQMDSSVFLAQFYWLLALTVDAKNEITVTISWAILVISKVSKVLSVLRWVLFIEFSRRWKLFRNILYNEEFHQFYRMCGMCCQGHACKVEQDVCEGFAFVHALLVGLAVEHPEARAVLLRLDGLIYLKIYKLPHLFRLSEGLFVRRSVGLSVLWRLLATKVRNCLLLWFMDIEGNLEDGPIVAKLPEVL